ncbi:Reversal of tor2 lethality [Orbilia oligospora]|uniref:Protein ROT1 n=1 Tax=Orbilia oligospora TaxID=2813651 RepID=A0A7C8NL87_ORBOL|nr:Reversal of tor2 lethality [Orbilia oligospora]KAF3080504.1 Reversal of tor2 lethality [Orbilia oligospora]KAF3095587.1 Reversal of tor2 lethality [Orbilia oligospora]KAF3118625.1 Reversal of tor2 lethality [Orbilia oligospora]KAF3122461.1 Reversal of tor2 lethality [Orbilia oligospora]
MRVNLAAASTFLASLIQYTTAANVTSLEGTWTSKSETVVTGPDIYDPVGERLIEPRLPGTAFSFTNDGYFEEAIYVVIGNPTTPECPNAIILWQHGKYTLYDNGSMVLFPFDSDGRKLWSDPCKQKKSIYTRYNQTELYRSWDIVKDDYRGQFRLNLYKFDGAPMNPLYLTYKPPQMLPTTTLNPFPTSTPTTAAKIKRSIENFKNSLPDGAPGLDIWWWAAVVMTLVGGLGVYLVRPPPS